ncbi:hypothetical protein B7494_g6534 [Chlorociboria aeruginascens]|nr:hypothetical protein B7494_g6534 [Chlorociboria aeruginascens]
MSSNTKLAQASPGPTPVDPPRSPKRPHPDDGEGGQRPLKLQKLELVPTAEEGEVKGRVYTRRHKVAKYADVIRKKRATANKVKRDWAMMPTSNQSGMTNLTGVLCYRHSLLQALLHLPMLVNWIINHLRPHLCCADSHQVCVSCALFALVQEYWCSRSTTGVTKALRHIDAVFGQLGWAPDAQNAQADPSEQVLWMIRMMRGELPASYITFHSSSELKLTIPRIFGLFEAFMQTTNRSLVACEKCSHQSITNAHEELLLSIPIQPRIKDGSLSQYLQKYMDEEVEDYRCEQCGDKGTKHRLQQIGFGPDTLIIGMKRFRYDGAKDNSRVEVQPILDLSPYQFPGVTKPLLYELCAVIKHFGNTVSGHYVASAKARDSTWYCFDDQQMCKTDVKAASMNKERFTPYLLFFQRKEN